MAGTDWPHVEASRRAIFEPQGRLAAVARGRSPVELAFREDQSLRHLAEILGIPASEIGAAFADGSSWPLELPPPDRSRVELYPVAEPLALAGRPSFVSDAHLARLARELRLLGFDSTLRRELSDDEFVETAMAEERALLSRDRALLFRRDLAIPAASRETGATSFPSMLVLATDPYEQLLEVARRFGLAASWRPLSLCSSCGGELEPLPKAAALPLVPRIVAERYESFWICPACRKVFWKGDHERSIEPLLARLRTDLAAEAWVDRPS